MTAFISWYILITLLGWLTFPLAYRLFPALADRGYTLSRTAGLLIWGYIFWLSTSLGISQNDFGGILLALAIIVGLSVWSFLTIDRRPQTAETVHRPSSIIEWLKENLRLVITTEILFLLAFAFLAIVRAANPEIVGTEKPMELAFINAILRSPTFPPHDPWLSGYAISYYYFGYVLAAMLAKITATPATAAFNLMLALVFALGAVGAYGILYNLLAIANPKLALSEVEASKIENRKSKIGLPLLAPLFLLIVSNIEGFLEIIHRIGLFWSSAHPSTSKFWTWLDVRDLTTPPISSSIWNLDQFRYLWWWRASRVVQDYDLAGNWLEIIDEFPFFSFLLGDLHPHVIAIPFGLLALAVALNLFLGASRATFKLVGANLHLSRLEFFFAALVLGGLAFLNTWDILVAAALIVLAYGLSRVHADGWRWNRIEDLILFGLPLAILAVILYFPFYLSFSSQAGGLLPNTINPARGAHLWIMFAPLFIPILAWLYWSATKQKPNWRLSAWIVLGFTLLLWGVSWAIALFVRFADPDFTAQYLASQGVATLGEFFKAASIRRLSSIGSLLTLLAILIPSVALLISKQGDAETGTHVNTEQKILLEPSTVNRQPSTFVFLLITLGGILVLAPEFLYLRDQFGWRLNTIFKFYYQAWILWSLAAAYGTALLLQNLRSAANVTYRIVIGVTLMMALIYPTLGLMTKTNNFKPSFGYTLDDFNRVTRENPDEAAAIQWLLSAPEGIMAEAVDPNPGGSYGPYARIATYSGLSTVLGWGGHESQWRGGSKEQGSRKEDITQLYTASSWEVANEIIRKYNIRYVYIGTLERTSMRVQEEKFKAYLHPVFQQGEVVIYETP